MAIITTTRLSRHSILRRTGLAYQIQVRPVHSRHMLSECFKSLQQRNTILGLYFNMITLTGLRIDWGWTRAEIGRPFRRYGNNPGSQTAMQFVYCTIPTKCEEVLPGEIYIYKGLPWREQCWWKPRSQLDEAKVWLCFEGKAHCDLLTN